MTLLGLIGLAAIVGAAAVLTWRRAYPLAVPFALAVPLYVAGAIAHNAETCNAGGSCAARDVLLGAALFALVTGLLLGAIFGLTRFVIWARGTRT